MIKGLLKEEERDLIAYLVIQLTTDMRKYSIPSQATFLDDGGMGSIRLTTQGKYHNDLIKMEYIDSDEQLALITLTQNEAGELFELDIYKVDFSALKKFPSPGKLKALQ